MELALEIVVQVSKKLCGAGTVDCARKVGGAGTVDCATG